MSAALIIFAKAPVAGQAKTRLIPALGPEGAARMAERLLMHTLQQALATPIEHIELCVSPSARHPAFERARVLGEGRVHKTQQGHGDLGQRKHRGMCRVLAQHSRALLIGTDAPGLVSTALMQAEQALLSHAAVFVPALDGGYALVGLTRPAPELFLDMRWSTPEVMQDSRARARAIGLPWLELPSVADIDEPADLVHLPEAWA
ncbi:TIGR04282 family arsenosugar biosynthesis glycosyltransferase [Roseateles sp.]|uniref:TIGR04282 family arsenosugar biosynthesis glycosyltransferase n=1 Tax=Roseateles sp. TaxID=1971397 RepID=UPI00286D590B|nr:TIGR04282 family arsenosugar biosynthesis glycosyltransferase [Roseateles sp.]